MAWEPVIGLEIHAQLATRSKIFSGSPTAYGAAANTQANAVDLGLPGVLPVINESVVEMAIKFGCAINARIAERPIFARKNYFYPDLPKGYQISQYEEPIVAEGELAIVVDDEERVIAITRAHLEEDAGKSLHGEVPGATGIDLNRAGTPLLEIVSEPVMHSAKEAVAYMREMHTLVRYLEICDGNMQEGSFRCDANVSVRPSGSSELGTRTEVKNLNSFRFVERAINFEIERQIEVIEDGGEVVQETRLYDPEKDETRPLRSKEDAHDYRYFPDPDLLPIWISAEAKTRAEESLPELPVLKRKRYREELGLSLDDVRLLAGDADYAKFFESGISGNDVNPIEFAKWIAGELSALLNADKVNIANSPIRPTDLADVVIAYSTNEISSSAAKRVIARMWQTGESCAEIIESENLGQISDEADLNNLVTTVIEESTEQVAQYRAGKTKILGYLVGQVMKASKGKANPKIVSELVQAMLRE